MHTRMTTPSSMNSMTEPVYISDAADVAASLGQVLAAQLRSQQPALLLIEDVAVTLGLSARTLQRRLAELALSYTKLRTISA